MSDRVIVLLSYVINAVAALTFIVVGALLLALRPARAGAVGFAAFALTAGAQHLFGNLAGVVEGGALAVLFAKLQYPFVLVAPLFIVYAALSYHGRVGIGWLAPFGFVAAAGAGVMAAAPRLLFDASGFETSVGTLLFSVPYFASIAVAGALLVARYARETSPRLRVELLLLICALLPYLAYAMAATVPLVWFFEPYVAWSLLALALGCLAVVLWTSVVLWRSGSRAARALAALDVAVAAIGIAQTTLIQEFAYFGGVLRFAAALLLGYGLLKHHVFGIDLGVKKGLAGAIAAGIVVAGFFLASEAAESLIEARTGSAAAGVVVAVALLVVETRVTHAGRRVAQRILPTVDATQAYFDARRDTVYRSAWESAAHDGRVTERERALLDVLARELGLTSDERSRIETAT